MLISSFQVQVSLYLGTSGNASASLQTQVDLDEKLEMQVQVSIYLDASGCMNPARCKERQRQDEAAAKEQVVQDRVSRKKTFF